MNVLAIDYGTKRIGIATGNTNSQIAFTKNFIENTKQSFSKIIEILEAEKTEKIIIGLPEQLGGEDSDSTENTREFFRKFQQFLVNKKLDSLAESLEFIDERFSTNTALQRLQFGKCKTKHKKSVVDSTSAQVLLETFFQKNY